MVAPSIELLVPALPAVLRVSGAVLTAPAFTMMPMSLRLVLAGAAGCIAIPLGADAPMPEGPWWMWAPLEWMAGCVIGLIAAAATEALRLMGRLAGEQMGLAMADSYGPARMDESNAAENLMGWAAAVIFVSIGGVESVALAAARSQPNDGSMWVSSADGVARAIDAAMHVGVRVCLPVLAISLAGAALGGVVVRAAPQTMTLAGGFGARAAMGLGMMTAAIGTAWTAQSDLVQNLMQRIPGGNIW